MSSVATYMGKFITREISCCVSPFFTTIRLFQIQPCEPLCAQSGRRVRALLGKSITEQSDLSRAPRTGGLSCESSPRRLDFPTLRGSVVWAPVPHFGPLPVIHLIFRFSVSVLAWAYPLGWLGARNLKIPRPILRPAGSFRTGRDTWRGNPEHRKQ